MWALWAKYCAKACKELFNNKIIVGNQINPIEFRVVLLF